MEVIDLSVLTVNHVDYQNKARIGIMLMINKKRNKGGRERANLVVKHYYLHGINSYANLASSRDQSRICGKCKRSFPDRTSRDPSNGVDTGTLVCSLTNNRRPANRLCSSTCRTRKYRDRNNFCPCSPLKQTDTFHISIERYGLS